MCQSTLLSYTDQIFNTLFVSNQAIKDDTLLEKFSSWFTSSSFLNKGLKCK